MKIEISKMCLNLIKRYDHFDEAIEIKINKNWFRNIKISIKPFIKTIIL